MEVLAAEIVLFLLFRAGGGFGSASQERPWVLQLYSLLSVGILGKVRWVFGRHVGCTTWKLCRCNCTRLHAPGSIPCSILSEFRLELTSSAQKLHNLAQASVYCGQYKLADGLGGFYQGLG